MIYARLIHTCFPQLEEVKHDPEGTSRSQSLKEHPSQPPPLPANGRSKKEPPIVGVTGRCTSYREKCLENPWLRLQEVNQVGQAKQTA